MSPGQARQTIRAYHLVVLRPREGHMLAIGQHVEEAGAIAIRLSFTVYAMHLTMHKYMQ